MQTVFDILYLISLIVTMSATYVVASQNASKMQKLMLLICFSALIVNLGFFMKILAVNDDGMLAGQKLIYTAMPFLTFFILLFVFDYCGIRLHSILKSVLSIYNLLLSFSVITQNQHKLFYKNYWVIYRDGVRCLKTSYGPFHNAMTITICVYFALILYAAAKYLVKNIRVNKMKAWRLFVTVLIPIPAYIYPKFANTAFEFHSPSIALFVAVLLALIYHDNLYDVSNVASRYIFQSMDEALVVLDAGFLFKGCNGKAKELFPQIVGLSLNDDIRTMAPEFEDFHLGKIKDFVLDDIIYEVNEFIISDEGKIAGKVIRFTDVTIDRIHTRLLAEQKKALESEVVTLSDISYHDELTGLYNRRYYEDKLEEIKNNGKLSELTLIVFDVNGLKQVNDEKGHAFGDELIVGASTVVKKAYGEFGYPCRIGGDEFTVVLPTCNKSIEELGKLVDDEVRLWNEEEHSVELSVSYGIVKASDYPNEDVDFLVKRADREMYEFKRKYYEMTGRDRRKR